MLTVGEVLGKGAFGVVNKAFLSGEKEGQGKMVAVKSLKGEQKLAWISYYLCLSVIIEMV